MQGMYTLLMDWIQMTQKHPTASQTAQTQVNHSLGQNQMTMKWRQALAGPLQDLPWCWNQHTCEGMDAVVFSLALGVESRLCYLHQAHAPPWRKTSEHGSESGQQSLCQCVLNNSLDKSEKQLPMVSRLRSHKQSARTLYLAPRPTIKL